MYRSVLLGLITFCTCAVAQEIRFRRIGMSDGLPQSYVNQIAQDMQGYLWIGTQDGLARYDGRRMLVYRNVSGDGTSIIGNNVHAMRLGVDSAMYFYTGNGVSRFDSDKGVFERIDPTAVPNQAEPVRAILIGDGASNRTYRDSRQREWMISTSRGVTVRNAAGKMIAQFAASQPHKQHLTSNDVRALCEDRLGRMWVGMNGGGVAIIDSMRIVARYRHNAASTTSLSSDVVRILFEDASGTMWIGTHGGGLCQYDPYRHLVPLLQPTQRGLDATDDFVRGITSDTTGRVFVGMRRGILHTDTMLRSSTMLVRWDDAYERIGAARALCADDQGRLWIGSEKNGLGVLNIATKKLTWLKLADAKHPFRATVSCIVRHDADHLLVGTDDGVALIDMRTLQLQWFRVPMSPLPDNPRVNVSAIVRLSNGEYLLGTEYGLFRGVIGAWTSKLHNTDPKCVRPNVDIIRAIELVNDTAYVATWGGGIRCIDLRSGRETVIDTRDGLPNNTIYAVYRMPDRSLVATSNAGIVVWDVAKNRLRQQITQAQGAQSNEFNSWSHHRIGASTMIFGGIGGLNLFRPHLTPAPPAPSVVIHLSGSTAEDLRYSATAIALSDAWPVVYRVRLISTDTVSYETANPEVVASTLKPGTYILEVQARYEGGEYGRAAVVSFSIPTPLWMSWWLYVGLAGVGGVVLWQASARITRAREQRSRESERLVQEERVRIARDLHDDVGTGLAKIVIMAENAVSEPDQESVRSIADTAQEVIDSVRSIVWVMKANDHRLASTIGYVQGKVADLMADKGIEFSYNERLLADQNIDTILMRNIVLAVKEIATNIVRHSRARRVSMKVISTEAKVSIEVCDDGFGFVKTQPTNGSGLLNLAERMLEVGGHIEIITGINTGTSVILEIPLPQSS